jgi:lipopolysaccharide export system protein LptA
MRYLVGLYAALLLVAAGYGAAAQPLDLTQGGPITVTARDGIEWLQAEQEVIARGDASAVRENVTVTADRLIAFYRKKAPQGGAAVQPAAAQPGAPDATDSSGNEIYRLRAEGNVHIFTTTDHAQGDVAVYDIDQAVLVMTGRNLKLTTPNEVLTARDSLEYWTQKHMAVARGNAVVLTKDARRLAGDVLVAYTTDTAAPATGGKPAPAAPAVARPAARPAAGSPSGASGDDLAASGKLEKVEAFGHVSVRTPTDTALGERAVYVPDSGIARLAGNVRITRGKNQLNGQEAEVNMKTGIARLLRGKQTRVTGLVVPNDSSNQSLPGAPPAPPAGGHP